MGLAKPRAVLTGESATSGCAECSGPFAYPQLHNRRLQTVCDLCTGRVSAKEHLDWIKRLVRDGLPVPAHAVLWLLRRFREAD